MLYGRGVNSFLKLRGGGGASSNAARHHHCPAAASILTKSWGAIATPAPPLLTPLNKVFPMTKSIRFLVTEIKQP